MVGMILDDVRRILLGLLFLVAFGWTAALILPGADETRDGGWQQTAGDGVTSVLPPAG